MRTAVRRFSLKPDSSHPRLSLGLVAALIIATVIGAVPAAAQNRSLPLYSIQRDAAELSSIDPLTGEEVAAAVALVDADGVETITGGTSVAVSPDGDLFGIICLTGTCDTDGVRVLGLIDPATGDVTIIGEITVDGTPLDRVSDLTFGADGTLYGITGRDFTPANTLFIIDPATGEATELVDLTIGTDFNRGNAIASNPEDDPELIYHLTFNSDTAAFVLRTLDPAAVDVAASIATVTLSGDTIGEVPRSMDFFGNGFFLVLDADGDMFLVASTGETRFISSDQSVSGVMHGVAFAGAPPSCPQALYGAANIAQDGPSLFYAIDPADGTPTLIGPTGFERVSGMAFESTGVLWAEGETMDGVDTPTLLTIDPCTGLGTASDPVSLASDTSFTDMSFRPSDGQLFAFLEAGPSPDNLATVDTADGTTVALGSPDSTRGSGLAIASDDTIFHVGANFPADELSKLDATDGLVISSVVLTYPAEGDDNPRINAMDFVDGVLVGSMPNARPAVDTFLVTIDNSGADPAVVTTVGPTQLGVDALASAAAFADLEIVKDVSQSTAVIGQRLSYFITVTNNGAADATNVIVDDPLLPADFTVDTIITSQGTCTDTTTITCELGDIEAGDSVDIELRGEATGAAALSNTATVIADQVDFLPANNTSTADSTSANFTVSATPATLSLSVGGSGTLNVTVTVTDGSVDEEIDLECLVLTPNVLMTCVFNPPTVTPGAGSATSTATVKVISFVAMQAPPPSSRPAAPLYAVWLGLPIVAFFGTLVFGGRRKQFACALAVGLLVLAMLPLAGCNNADEVVPEPTIVNFQVVGELGAHSVNSSTVTVTVP